MPSSPSFVELFDEARCPRGPPDMTEALLTPAAPAWAAAAAAKAAALPPACWNWLKAAAAAAMLPGSPAQINEDIN